MEAAHLRPAISRHGLAGGDSATTPGLKRPPQRLACIHRWSRSQLSGPTSRRANVDPPPRHQGFKRPPQRPACIHRWCRSQFRGPTLTPPGGARGVLVVVAILLLLSPGRRVYDVTLLTIEE
ncbi:hypothetical protein KGM_214794 [Danaus plexippus plexippus]|uniref:Uncharacterized protein n=1 Tax=Danaus plexippus plexippus TaxID=278856 RepID=A0A212ET00_DANPL|nr:hypothetical protein KGM_214794 [Danaus plexippus plexippus]